MVKKVHQVTGEERFSRVGVEPKTPLHATVSMSPAVSQPKRTFNGVRSPKDLTSDSSISRWGATPLRCGLSDLSCVLLPAACRGL